MIIPKYIQSLIDKQEVSVFMIFAHLVMQTTIFSDVTPAELNQVCGTDTCAIITEQEIILAVLYQRPFFQFKRDNTLHLRIAQFFFRCLYAFVFEYKKRIL